MLNAQIPQVALPKEAAWKKEWDYPFTLLPPHKQDAILSDPMDTAADELDEIVEKALCERGGV